MFKSIGIFLILFGIVFPVNAEEILDFKSSELVPIQKAQANEVTQNINQPPKIQVDSRYVSVNSIIFETSRGKEEISIKLSYVKNNLSDYVIQKSDKETNIIFKINFLFNKPLYSEAFNKYSDTNLVEEGKIKILADNQEVKLYYCSKYSIDKNNPCSLSKWSFRSNIYYYNPDVNIGAKIGRIFDRNLGTQIERELKTELGSKNGMQEEEFSNLFELENLKTLISAQRVEIKIFNDKYILPPESLEKLRLFYIAALKAVDTPFQSQPSRKSPFSN